VTIVDIARFSTGPGDGGRQLTDRPARVDPFRDHGTGLVRSDLIRIGEDDWLDYSLWEAVAEAGSDRADSPTLRAFIADDGIAVTRQRGTLVPDPVDALLPVTIGSTIELTGLRTAPGEAQRLLDARHGMTASFRLDRVGFRRAELVRLGEDEWLDVIAWATPESFAASRVKGANTPEIARFFQAIAAVTFSAQGSLERVVVGS
jgi:hypothetical protein